MKQNDWVRARLGESTNYVELSSRVVLQVKPNADLAALLKSHKASVARHVRQDLVILQAADATGAIDLAEALAGQAGVVVSYPVMRRTMRLHGRYAPAPTDPYFSRQWHLENRDTNGLSLGVDLNVRAAWSLTQGEGVLVGVADDGFELTHPDLKSRASGQPHYNFHLLTTNGAPESTSADHATAVAGLVAAEAGNGIGVAGVAPKANLASWVIFAASPNGDQIVSDEALMDMFQYATDRVSVQNHSWGNAGISQSPLDTLSDQGIATAISAGRRGLGVVLVRAAGNERDLLANANDDGFGSDPRAIAVAAVRMDGTVCSYSSPGACVLVAAPSGEATATGLEDPSAPNLVTTDRQGANGYNTSGTADGANYAFGDTGFNGTSASSPEIAGIAALILAANPALGYRDVQQILIHSSRHHVFNDPDLHTNAAGFIFSHNLGYGVPDAGFAVALAKGWSNRPSAQQFTQEAVEPQTIPLHPYRLLCQGPGLADALSSIEALPFMYEPLVPNIPNPHPDAPTTALPLVYVGQATEDLTQDLHGKAALIQRGVSLFTEKIQRAARAGARFAVIFNNVGATNVSMGGEVGDSVPILAISIGKNDGEALRDYITSHPDHTAQIVLNAATMNFDVPETALCEHVGVEVQTTAPYRGDLRITLTSPAGTRSVLQDINADGSPGPTDWTYWSAQHFYESSAGQWRLEVSNEYGTNDASLTYAKLLVEGVPITDTDHDGLDDDWEMRWFGSLAQGPLDNPSGDGYNHARKQILGWDPTRFTPLAGPDLSFWNNRLARVSFPAAPNQTYQVLTNSDFNHSFGVLTNLAGRLPEIEVFVPYVPNPRQFLKIVPATSAGAGP